MSSAPQVRPRLIRLADFHRGRCAKSTAHKWINEGKLRAFRLGRMTFVDQTFDEFIEQHSEPVVAALTEPSPPPAPTPETPAEPAKRRRGRPPGSKTKNRSVTASAQAETLPRAAAPGDGR